MIFFPEINKNMDSQQLQQHQDAPSHQEDPVDPMTEEISDQTLLFKTPYSFTTSV